MPLNLIGDKELGLWMLCNSRLGQRIVVYKVFKAVKNQESGSYRAFFGFKSFTCQAPGTGNVDLDTKKWKGNPSPRR